MNLKNKYMKNIHVLPTDKPSRLFFNNNKFIKKFEATKGRPFVNGITNNQNHFIYIVSNEEIKEKDCCLEFNSLGTKVISLCKAPQIIPGECILKKIILTTDQELIKDGVQAIDDEFLEWFIKNSSCKEVKVILSDVSFVIQDTVYKIIIPKEESTKCYCGHTTYCDCGPKEETAELKCDFCKRYPRLEGTNKCDSCYSVVRHFLEQDSKLKDKLLPDLRKKQETMEKAARKEYQDTETAFLRGVKWQAERMYSEEEVKELLSKFHIITDGTKKFEGEWFEQFKKK